MVALEGPVRLGDEIRRTGQIVADLCLENTLVISCIFMDANKFQAGQVPLLVAVQHEGIEL